MQSGLFRLKQRRARRIACAVAVLLILATDAASAQTICTWTGGIGGAGDAWRQANNWRPSPGQGGPGSGDVALFSTNGTAAAVGINFNDGLGLVTAVGAIQLAGGASRGIFNSAPNSSGTLRIDGRQGLLLANDTASSLLSFSNGAGSMMSVQLAAGGEVRASSAFAVIDLACGVAGSQGLVKTGSGLLRLSHSNSLAGDLVVAGGTLELAASAGGSLGAAASLRLESGARAILAGAHQIGDATSLVLAGGTLRGATGTVPVDETIGALTLSASSTIDLGASKIVFADSSSIVWMPSATLTITNWRTVADGDAGRLFFGPGGLSSGQLAQIYFADLGIRGARLAGPRGELCPIPEAPVFAAAAALAAFVLWRERRRFAAVLRRRVVPRGDRSTSHAREFGGVDG